MSGSASRANEAPTSSANGWSSASSSSTSDALADVESRVEEAVTAAATGGPAHAMVDDPLMDDEGPDPMMERTQNGDLAPGAPELDMEKDPAE